ncbi:MAG: VWA domain-containing protein, partial [Planctomycetota bacterium]
MMSFAVPGALLLLGLALPIILLYILKVRLRRVEVSTNLFWRQIYEEKPPRSIWQYFRHLLSLLLQLLLLALLAFSVADPYFPWQLLQARRMVLVIDNSASMQATDIGPTRFDAAIQAATSVVEGLRFRDRMAIVLAGPTPDVVIGMSSHVPTLKRSLEEIKVSDNPTQLQSAIDLAKKLVGEHDRGQVVVFTDGCDPEVREQVRSPGFSR